MNVNYFLRSMTLDGEIILAYALLYAVARFVLEYFRGDVDRGFVFGGLFSTSQFIGIVVFIAASILLVIRPHASRETSP